MALRRCQGIFPDGTPFDIPTTSPAPEPLEIPAEMKNTTIGIAVPLMQADTLEISSNTSDTEEKTLTRYKIKELSIKDLHTADIDSQAELQVGTLNMRLLAATEKQNAFAVIPLTRIIERHKDGMIHLDKDFITAISEPF